MWGCDAPAPRPVLEITCTTCNGEHGECCECWGLGKLELFRCPRFYSEPDVVEGFRAYFHLEGHGAYPVGGGLLEQAASFLCFVDEVNRERFAIEAEKRKAEEFLAKLKGGR